jgi:adenine-specific DNA-methyltransferase
MLRNYEELKTRYDTVLNKDKNTFKTSNDEPTPIGCIEEMMSKVPPEFWSKRVSILDPCCGNGNFHLVVLKHLQLAGHSYQDALSFCKFNDINAQRLANVRDIFPGSHVTDTDFLATDDEETEDMIVGNPPYALITDGKRASKNHNMSRAFVEKSMRKLKPGGFLVYLIPDNWMSYADRNTLVSTLTSYQFIHIDIHLSKKWFPKVGSTFTWFVVQKVPGTNPFSVSCLYKKAVLNGTVQSQVRQYIPLVYNEIVQSIVTKTLDADLPRYNIETSSDLHKYTKATLIRAEKTPDFCWRLIHTPKQTVWANRPHKYQDGWKVFISVTDTYKAFVDNCGMTQSIAFIRCENEEDAKNVQVHLEHPLYRFLNNICRYGNFNNIRVLQHFPVWRDFGLTPQEEAFIRDER